MHFKSLLVCVAMNYVPWTLLGLEQNSQNELNYLFQHKHLMLKEMNLVLFIPTQALYVL